MLLRRVLFGGWRLLWGGLSHGRCRRGPSCIADVSIRHRRSRVRRKDHASATDGARFLTVSASGETIPDLDSLGNGSFNATHY
jgi:hypothetical protein